MNYEELLDQLNKLTAQVKDLIAEKEERQAFIFDEDGTSCFIEKHDDVVFLRAGKGYNEHVDLVCSLRNTGNGYIAFFPSHANHTQDNFICMNYAEADYLQKLLSYVSDNDM